MTERLRKILLSVGVLGVMVAPVFAAAPVALAAATNYQNHICAGANFDISGNSGTCPNNANTGSLNTILTLIINIFSAIVGVIAVIMIIVGGLRYITSGGDSNKVSAAKSTLLYAIIGLVIVALAQLIVHFVLNEAINIGG